MEAFSIRHSILDANTHQNEYMEGNMLHSSKGVLVKTLSNDCRIMDGTLHFVPFLGFALFVFLSLSYSCSCSLCLPSCNISAVSRTVLYVCATVLQA